MDRVKKDKIHVSVVMGISLAVIVTAALMAAFGGVLENVPLAVVTILIIGISLVFMAYAARALMRDISKGMPFRDERSKRVMEKAAGFSFIVMIYLLLAIGWYSDRIAGLLPTDVTAIGVLGGSVSFAVFWAFLNSRASLD